MQDTEEEKKSFAPNQRKEKVSAELQAIKEPWMLPTWGEWLNSRIAQMTVMADRTTSPGRVLSIHRRVGETSANV